MHIDQEERTFLLPGWICTYTGEQSTAQEIGINERQSALVHVEAHLEEFASKGYLYEKT